mgnify:CR=1 FL=1
MKQVYDFADILEFVSGKNYNLHEVGNALIWVTVNGGELIATRTLDENFKPTYFINEKIN